MALDITAYSKLRLATDESAINSDRHPNITRLALKFTEMNWPGRTEGLAPGVHEYHDSYGFRAGSYSGYNDWRRDLCLLAHKHSIEQLWRLTRPTGAFVELLCFADNEGLIGPVVSAKLAKDFTDWQARAEMHATEIPDGGWWLDLYNKWRLAFALAADGGCVEFH
jgi:hypothetical protein